VRGGAVLGPCVLLDGGAKAFNVAERQRHLELDGRNLAKARVRLKVGPTEKGPAFSVLGSGGKAELRRDELEDKIHSNKNVCVIHDAIHPPGCPGGS